MSVDVLSYECSWHMANTWSEGGGSSGESFGGRLWTWTVKHGWSEQVTKHNVNKSPCSMCCCWRSNARRAPYDRCSFTKSQSGTSHLWFMSHGTLMQCVQCTSHGCSCPRSLSLSFFLIVWTYDAPHTAKETNGPCVCSHFLIPQIYMVARSL